MFADLYVDNLVIASQLRASVRRASEAEDLPYAESCEKWLQDTERRASFLLEACQGTD
jgi:DNA-binding ferritin-like protein